jgi:hypothetical protein
VANADDVQPVPNGRVFVGVVDVRQQGQQIGKAGFGEDDFIGK